MSSDLHIHVYEGVTESDMADFFSNTLGSKYFAPRSCADMSGFIDASKKINATPNIHVGEVSWLKAAVFEDDEAFVPDPIGKISEIINHDEGQLRELTPGVRDEILSALKLENNTGYSIANGPDVEKFLNEHMGKKLFTVSW